MDRKKRLLLLNEMMDHKSTSYAIRYDTAMRLSQEFDVLMISPNYKAEKKNVKRRHNNDFMEVKSLGFLSAKFRRGGFGFLDLLCKIRYVFKFKPDVVFTTSGHRPSQLIPSLIAKLFFHSFLIDERWEFYGKGGRSDERKGFIGKMIRVYDKLFEAAAVGCFDKCIAVSHFLKDKLKRGNVIFYPGVIDFEKYKKFDYQDVRNELGIKDNVVLIGLLSLGKLDHDDYAPFYDAIEKILKTNKNIFLFCTGEDNYIKDVIIRRFDDHTIFKGWLEKSVLFKYLSSCDIFLLPLNPSPRNLGRWPIKFNEFVFYNRPIITSSRHDIATFLNNKNLIRTYDYVSDEKVIDRVLLQSIEDKNTACSLKKDAIAALSIDGKVDFLKEIMTI